MRPPSLTVALNSAARGTRRCDQCPVGWLTNPRPWRTMSCKSRDRLSIVAARDRPVRSVEFEKTQTHASLLVVTVIASFYSPEIF
jgi:hypothetical protein